MLSGNVSMPSRMVSSIPLRRFPLPGLIGFPSFLYCWFCIPVLFPALFCIVPLLQGAHLFRNDPHYLITNWETENGLPENSATAIAQTPDGYLWFGTIKGLVRFNGIDFKVLDSETTGSFQMTGS